MSEQVYACGVVAWLATIGARATVVCSLTAGHDGPHHDEQYDVDWVTE